MINPEDGKEKKYINKRMRFIALKAGFLGALLAFSPLNLEAEDKAVLPLPEFYLNGQSAVMTVQDLSGLATRPLRLLIKRNNEPRNAEFIQTYALGVRDGDQLKAELSVPAPGLRLTVYRIFRAEDGPRYLSMPTTVYFTEPGNAVYEERIEPFKEEILIVIFEKTDSPDEQNIQIRYFQERVRKLVLASYKTNLIFSSLKFKMKDFSEGDEGEFFQRDAQLLVDRLQNPQQIYLIRLWRIKP